MGVVLGQRNPNPCLGVPGSTEFRNDWSSCEDFFWCNNGVAVAGDACPQGLDFVEEEQACILTDDPCDECPPHNIAVSSSPYDN